jgi:hypothetical protein
MKVFGARADEVGTVLALENTDFFCFLSGLNFFAEARYSLHVVRFFRPRETHSMMTIGDARTKRCALRLSHAESPHVQTIGIARFGTCARFATRF